MKDRGRIDNGIVTSSDQKSKLEENFLVRTHNSVPLFYNSLKKHVIEIFYRIYCDNKRFDCTNVRRTLFMCVQRNRVC